MTKRAAEEPLLLLHDTSSKRSQSSLQVETLPPRPPPSLTPQSLDGAANLKTPSVVLTAPDNHCRKRPHGSEETVEEDTSPNTRIHDANGSPVQPSRSFQEAHRDISAGIGSKRLREDNEHAPTEALDEVVNADANGSEEDCAYNSFQFWRTPLPELDLSLLEDTERRLHTEDGSKVKNCFTEAMET